MEEQRRQLAAESLRNAGLDPAQFLAAGQLAEGGSPPAPPPPAPRAPPPAPAQPMSAMEAQMARMMTLLERQMETRTQELEIQRSQAQNSLRLTEALQRQVDKPASDRAVEKGRVALVEPRNAVALGLSGVTLGSQYGVEGDVSSVDLSKKGKLLNSGRDPSVQLKAIVAEVWPNEYLHPVIWNSLVKYENLTLVSFVVGFVTKAFAEFDPARTGSRDHNLLRILMELLKVVETHSFADAHKLGECLFSGLERGTLKWEDWDGP